MQSRVNTYINTRIDTRIKDAREILARLEAALLEPGCTEIERLNVLLEPVTLGLGAELRDAQKLALDAAEVSALRADLGRTACLLKAAASFQNAWASVLGAAAGGYTQGGQAAALEAQRRMSVQG